MKHHENNVHVYGSGHQPWKFKFTTRKMYIMKIPYLQYIL